MNQKKWILKNSPIYKKKDFWYYADELDFRISKKITDTVEKIWNIF